MSDPRTIGGVVMNPETPSEIIATIDARRADAIKAINGMEKASEKLSASLPAFWHYCDSIAVLDGETLDQPQAWWAWTHETLDGCPNPTIPNPESDEPMTNPEWSTLKTTASNAFRCGALAVEMDVQRLPDGAFTSTDRTFATAARFAGAVRSAVKASDHGGNPVEMVEIPDIIGGRDVFRKTPNVAGLADIVGSIDANAGDKFRQTMKLTPRPDAPMTGPAALKSLRRPFDSGVQISRIIGSWERRMESSMTIDEIESEKAFVIWLDSVATSARKAIARVEESKTPDYFHDSGDES